MSTEMSVIIPAYNEAQRLPPYLRVIRDYLEALFPRAHEVFVVDDGSDDGTAACVLELGREWPGIHIIQLDKNAGKGRAVRRGVTMAAGKYVLVTDADGATPIAEESKLRQSLLEGAEIAIGSRRLRSHGVERSCLRDLAGRMFAGTVCRLLHLPLRDTQCGFKMFRGNVAKQLFESCRESGFLIDVEVLMYAQRLGCRVVEVPVVWREVPGSKVRLVRDGWKMCQGLLRLRHICVANSTAPLSNQRSAIAVRGGERVLPR
jgi:dolichyl-phosphate beta-glucosyltransferase